MQGEKTRYSGHELRINSYNLFISSLALDKQPYSDRDLTTLKWGNKLVAVVTN